MSEERELTEDQRLEAEIERIENDVRIMESFEDFEDFGNGGENEKPIFPIEQFPDVLRIYSEEVSNSLQVPIDMVAVSLLGVMAICLQGKFYIRPRKDWIEPLNLYIAIIANPSERKTPVLKEISYPINSYVANVNRELKPKHDEYLMRKSILSKKVSNLSEQASKSKGKVTVDNVIDAKRELEELEEVKLLKLIIDDITPEALVNVMRDNNEIISLVSAEGGLFGMLSGRYSNRPNLDIFLKAYSGEPYHSDRIGRESADLDKPLLTILIMIQHIVLKDALENREFRERGLLARFAYSVPKSNIGKRQYAASSINDEVRKNYNELVYELLESNTKRGFTTLSNIINLSEEANRLSEQFFYEIERKIPNEYETFEDWAGKHHGNTMRIAGILHCVKYGLNAPNVLLEADTMREAIEIGHYFSRQASYVFDNMADNEKVKDAKYLLKNMILIITSNLKIPKILKISKRDLHQKCKGKYKYVEELEPGLLELEKRGYIKRTMPKSGKSGRPTEYIYINPKYLEQQKGKDNEKKIISS